MPLAGVCHRAPARCQPCRQWALHGWNRNHEATWPGCFDPVPYAVPVDQGVTRFVQGKHVLVENDHVTTRHIVAVGFVNHGPYERPPLEANFVALDSRYEGALLVDLPLSPDAEQGTP